MPDNRNQVSCDVYSLIRQAGVPWKRLARVVLPRVQLLKPTVDAKYFYPWTGLSTAIRGTYRFYFQRIIGVEMPETLEISVVEEYPEGYITYNSETGTVKPVITKHAGWVYKYALIIRGCPPEMVHDGKCTLNPFVKVLTFDKDNEPEVDPVAELRKEYGNNLPLGAVHVELVAFPDIYGEYNDLMIDWLVADELSHALLTLYPSELSKLRLIEVIQNSSMPDSAKKAFVDAINQAYELLRFFAEFVYVSELPPAPIVSVNPAEGNRTWIDIYTMQLPEVVSVNNGISLSIPYQPYFFDKTQALKFADILKRGLEAVATLYSVSPEPGQGLVLNSENKDKLLEANPAYQQLLKIKDQLDSLSKLIDENKSSLVASLSQLLDSIEKIFTAILSPRTVDVQRFSSYILFPSALWGGVSADMYATFEDFTQTWIHGDVTKIAGGTTVRLPEQVLSTIQMLYEGWGLKKVYIRTMTPLGLKRGFRHTEVIKVEYDEKEKFWDPVLGWAVEARVSVDRDTASQILGMSKDQLEQLTDEQILQLIAQYEGLDAVVLGLVFSFRLQGRVVDWLVPLNTTVILPLDVAKRPGFYANLALSEISTMYVNENPDMLVIARPTEVTAQVNSWNFVQRLGFDVYGALVYRDSNTIRVAIAKGYNILRKDGKTSDSITVQYGSKLNSITLSNAVSRAHNTMVSIDVERIAQSLGGVQVLLHAWNFVPNFAWLPNRSRKKYADMSIRTGWPVILNYRSTLDAKRFTLYFDVPSWLSDWYIEIYPLVWEGGKVKPVADRYWLVKIDNSSGATGVAVDFEVIPDAEKSNMYKSDSSADFFKKLFGGEGTQYSAVHKSNDSTPVKLYYDPNDIGNYAGVLIKAYSRNPLFPILYKPIADTVASKIYEAVRRTKIVAVPKVSGGELAYDVVIEGEDLEFEIGGIQVKMTKEALAGIKQAIVFMYAGFSAYGLLATDEGLKFDPMYAVQVIAQYEGYITPYLVMSAMFLAPIFGNAIQEVATALNVPGTPYIISTPESLIANMPSMLVVSPPNYASVETADIQAYSKKLVLQFTQEYKAPVNLTFYYSADGQHSTYTFVPPVKSHKLKVPIRDLAILALVRAVGLNDITVADVDIKLGPVEIKFGEKPFVDALEELFQKMWEKHIYNPESEYSQHFNALDITEVQQAVADLARRANQQNGGLLAREHPDIYDILTEFQDVGLDRVDVELFGAIISLDNVSSGRVAGHLAYRVVPQFMTSDEASMWQASAPNVVTDIADAEDKFVSATNLPQKIVEFLTGDAESLPDSTFLYFSAPKVYEIPEEGGQNVKKVPGYEKFSIVDIVDFVATTDKLKGTAEVKQKNVKEALKEAFLYVGNAKNLWRVAGHMPYASIHMNIVGADRVPRNLIYRVNLNDIRMPKYIRKVNMLALAKPGFGNALYIVNDQYDSNNKVLGGTISFAGFSKVYTLNGKDYLYQSDLPGLEPAEPVSFNIDVAYNLYIDHPMALDPPALRIQAEIVSNWEIDIDPKTFYEKVELVLETGSNQFASLDVTPKKPGPYTLRLTKDDGVFEYVKYTFYIKASAGEDRYYGRTLLDTKAGWTLPAFLKPGQNSTVMTGTGAIEVLKSRIVNGPNGEKIYVLETDDTYKDIWNFSAYFNQSSRLGVIVMFLPVVTAEFNLAKRQVHIAVSGVPTDLVNMMNIQPKVPVPGYATPSYTVKLEKGQAFIPIDCSELLPPTVILTPMIGERKTLLLEATTTVNLPQPSVDVKYDSDNNEVVVHVSDFGACDRVKVKVYAVASDQWTVEKCLRAPQYLGQCPNEIDPSRGDVEPEKADQGYLYRIPVGGKPGIVAVTVYDCFGGVLMPPRILKQVTDAYKVPKKGVWVAYVTPGEVGAVIDKDSQQAFEEVLNTLKTLRQYAFKIQRYKSVLTSDVLGELISIGVDIGKILQWNPNEQNLETFLKSIKVNPPSATGESYNDLYDYLTKNYGDLWSTAFYEAYTMAKILQDAGLVKDWGDEKQVEKAIYCAQMLFETAEYAPYLGKMLEALAEDSDLISNLQIGSLKVSEGPLVEGTLDTEIGYRVGADTWEVIEPKDIKEELEDGDSVSCRCESSRYIWPSVELAPMDLRQYIEWQYMGRRIYELFQKKGPMILGGLAVLYFLLGRKR